MNEEHSVKTRRLAGLRRLSQRTCAALKGHPVACLGLGLSLVVGALALALLGQRSSAAAAPDQLSAGLAIYQQGEFRLAQALFAEISPSDPAYAVAQAYDALCRYELCRAVGTNDYRWFLSALESPTLAAADLPGELREDLAFKEIDALYHSGQFEERQGFAKVSTFFKSYPASSHAAEMREYELAARFERGMAQIYKVSLADPRYFQTSWTNGVAHLERFLTCSGVFPANEYSVLKDRSLAEDLQVALAMLGGKPAALAEIPIRAPDRRERYGLIRLGLHLRLNPSAWEQNLQMLAEYQAHLQTFPPSSRRPRVECDLARFALRAGEQLYQENAGAVPGEEQMARAKYAGASRYFQTVRALEQRAEQAQWAGIEAADGAWLRFACVVIRYFEQDYAGLSAAAEAELAQLAPGTVAWMRAKMFSGIGLYRQSPAQRDTAASAFEEVLGMGFRNEHEHDLVVLESVGWRMQLALLTGDYAKVRALFDWVKQGACVPLARDGFLRERREYAALVGWTEPK